MTPEQVKFWIGVVAFAAMASLEAYGVWYVTSDHYKRIEAEDIASALKAKADEISRMSGVITQLEKRHAKDNDDIEYLHNHPAIKRVLLPCQAGDSSGAGASGGELRAAGGNGASGAAQSALDDFTKGLGDDAAEWGRAIAACKVMQGYINSLPVKR